MTGSRNDDNNDRYDHEQNEDAGEEEDKDEVEERGRRPTTANTSIVTSCSCSCSCSCSSFIVLQTWHGPPLQTLRNRDPHPQTQSSGSYDARPPPDSPGLSTTTALPIVC